MAFEGLRQVGEFQNLNKRHLIRSTKNPMDRCTIVSILPKLIEEYKHTIEPGKFVIPPGDFDKPSILVVGPSSWWAERDADQPLMEIPVSSIQIANSVINDYCNGMLGCNMADAMPGMFFALGEHKVADIKLKYKDELEKAKTRQDNWYKILVRLADSLWSRANGNPLSISDEMRLAARALNFNDKPWLKDFVIAEQVKCVACGSLRNPNFPICATCKAVADPELAAKLNLKFA